MIYLILAFCSSALISIIMRCGEGRIRNNISQLAVNYVICLLLSIAYSAGAFGLQSSDGSAGSGGLSSLIVPMDTGRMTIILGIISGFFYLGSFILYQYNIFRNGVLMSAAFMKLGVLVPTFMAILVFGERPGMLQTAGICLAIAAILIVNSPGRSEKSEGSTVASPKALIILLIAGGTGDAMAKIYEELGKPEFSSQYLLYTFAVALILCILVAVIRGQKLTGPDILFGCLVGVPNFYSARFLLMSLSYVPAVIAYPTYSVGTILLTGAAGVILFHEKMTQRQWTAVGMVLAAMIFMNL
jgi:drug/metabolite transporter (DMT)-like permease